MLRRCESETLKSIINCAPCISQLPVFIIDSVTFLRIVRGVYVVETNGSFAAGYVLQKRHTGEQETHWDKTNNGSSYFK